MPQTDNVQDSVLRNWMDASDDWLWEVDAQGIYTYTNPQVEKILGYLPSEIINRQAADLMPPQESRRFTELFRQLKETGKPMASIETINLHKTGRHVTLETNGIPIHDVNGCLTGYQGVHRNITHCKQLVKKLRIRNRELQDIVYTASHDLKSPVVNIQGFGNELKTDCRALQELLAQPDQDEQSRTKIENLLQDYIPQSLDFIMQSTQKISSLLDGLLQISRIGTINIIIKQVRMNELIQNILKTMDYQIQQYGITVTTESLPDCIGDPQMLDRIFTNLISNAVKYHDPQKKPQIHISGAVVNEQSNYYVTDNGIGIADAHLEKVFEIFHRLHPHDNIEGEGLGLTIVMRILDRLGGQVHLDSELGQGSQFCIALPTA